MRLVFTLIGTLALGGAGHAYADQWNKHWSVGPKPELRIYTNDASIVVQAVDGNGIDATLTTRGVSIGSNGVQVSEHQSGNNVDINVKVPNMHFSFGDRSIRLEVRVPRELVSEVHTGDGSVRLIGLHGSVRADTGDGSIQAEDLDGSFDAHTGDGSVHVGGRFDHVILHTSDGSVTLSAGRGSRMASDWKVETGDGSVRLTVPHDLAADVELATNDGSIHSDLQMMTESKRSSGHLMTGKLNGGGPSLRVRTGDGSISIGTI